MVLAIAAAVVLPFVFWWRSNTKSVERRREHWFGAFAAERGGTFHSGVGSGGPEPTFGVVHPTGRPLAGAGHKSWVEFPHRDRRVIAVDEQVHYRGQDDHTHFRDHHVTQVRVPPSPELRIVPGQPVSLPELPPDAPLVAELGRWLAANPGLARRPVVVQHGSARTWGEGCATRPGLLAEADHLIDLADRLPAAFWRPPSH